MTLPDGLYDLLLTEALAARLDFERADVLAGLSRRELVSGAEHGFGSLPPGCHIQLQRHICHFGISLWSPGGPS